MFGANDMCETHVAILRDLLGPGPWPSAQTYVVLGFRWVYEYGERIKVYDNKEDDPTFSAPKPAASSGVGDDDGMDIFGAIMGNPFDTEFDDTYDGHDEDDDYWREPSPLDPVEQCEREASQSRQSAPTVSSAPPPPPPPPPPPTPMPHHPPAASGSAQHAPTASTTGPASLPPRPPAPAPGLPDVNAPHPVAPVRHPPPALDSSYHRSAARPPEPRPVPMSREPPRAPR
ncbi:hypothetical protein BS47DRAFT_1402254, partial [Hydnum rufescens UP504]